MTAALMRSSSELLYLSVIASESKVLVGCSWYCRLVYRLNRLSDILGSGVVG